MSSWSSAAAAAVDDSEAAIEAMAKAPALRRLGGAGDVAAVIAFLLGP